MANRLPRQDLEAQLPVAGDLITSVAPPDSSRKLVQVESCNHHRDSSATTILPPVGTLDSRRPSVVKQPSPATSSGENDGPSTSSPKHPWWHPITRPVVQMIIAAGLAVVIGIVVAATVDEVPDAARALLAIPGDIWLRALKCIGKYKS